MDCSPPHPYEESAESDYISDTDGMDEIHGRVRTHPIHHGGMKDMTNEYKLAWQQVQGSILEQQGQKHNKRRAFIKRYDMMHLVSSTSGTGKDKFQRLFLPMTEHIFDVGSVVNPFVDAHMKVIAIRRIIKRLNV